MDFKINPNISLWETHLEEKNMDRCKGRVGNQMSQPTSRSLTPTSIWQMLSSRFWTFSFGSMIVFFCSSQKSLGFPPPPQTSKQFWIPGIFLFYSLEGLKGCFLTTCIQSPWVLANSKFSGSYTDILVSRCGKDPGIEFFTGSTSNFYLLQSLKTAAIHSLLQNICMFFDSYFIRVSPYVFPPEFYASF